MKVYNGNHRNILNIASWNGGSSYLGKSVRGKEKLESIKQILKSYDIDILVVPEANIEIDTLDAEHRIEGYKLLKSNGNIVRVCLYYKENLVIKTPIRYDNKESSIWVEIGRGLNKWILCVYYRQFKNIGCDGSDGLDE